MKQIIHIHWWETFANDDAFYKALETWEYEPFKEKRRWSKWLAEQTSNEYQMFAPDMPCYKNAKYKARKIWFEKIFPFLNDEELIMTGSSLWGLFLAKYLSENMFPKHITQLHLVAWVFDKEGLPKGEDALADFILDPNKLNNLDKQVDQIFLYHSTDDPMVPFSHVEKYKSYLPKAQIFKFHDRGHFNVPELPELLENIRKYSK